MKNPWELAFEEIALWALHKAGQSVGVCGRCDPARLCPCVDYNSVDIGVGDMTFDHEYLCPEHGCFAYKRSDDFRPSEVIYQDDAGAPE